MKLDNIAPLLAATVILFGGPTYSPLAADGRIQIDSDDIGGVVAGPNGPEAGAWVIAESDELATRMIKIVVTDDQGRFVLPDMPKATYTIFARAYSGLIPQRSTQHRATAT